MLLNILSSCAFIVLNKLAINVRKLCKQLEWGFKRNYIDVAILNKLTKETENVVFMSRSKVDG